MMLSDATMTSLLLLLNRNVVPRDHRRLQLVSLRALWCTASLDHATRMALVQACLAASLIASSAPLLSLLRATNLGPLSLLFFSLLLLFSLLYYLHCFGPQTHRSARWETLGKAESDHQSRDRQQCGEVYLQSLRCNLGHCLKIIIIRIKISLNYWSIQSHDRTKIKTHLSSISFVLHMLTNARW